MTDASIVAEPAYDQVLPSSSLLVDGMAPPLRFVRGRLLLFDLP